MLVELGECQPSWCLNTQILFCLPDSAEFPNCREILPEVPVTCEPNLQNIHPTHSVKKLNSVLFVIKILTLVF